MAQKKQEGPEEFIEILGAFDAGTNTDLPPLILPRNQMAGAINTTVRNNFVTQRSVYRKLILDPVGQALIDGYFTTGHFQGAAFYNPDSGHEKISMVVAGHFLNLIPDQITLTATVEEPAFTSPAATNPPSQQQAWLWQAENYMIWTDGLSPTQWYDGTTINRSNYGTQTKFSTRNTANFNIPALNASVVVTLAATAPNLVVGDVVTLYGRGQMKVLDIAGLNATMLNLSALPVGELEQDPGIANKNFFWYHQGNQLPPGRMGTYGMGRNWMSLVDGKQFIAGDLVGGSSGTQATNFRDAVLYITENTYLAGGGNFTVPGSRGDIKAMRFAATLDSSLGQGPLEVFTATNVFSCNAPVDRLTWQDITNPILTESLKGFGALGQYSTINANSDILFRQYYGIGSLILARREFDTWGNVPISREINNLMLTDDQTLLNFSSAIAFDNRLLMTARPEQIPQGVIHKSLVALNFDPISSLRGKAPSVYDSEQWIGLNIFQLVVGEFNNVERAFALCWNITTEHFELYEILRTTSDSYLDNDNERIVWMFQTSSLFRDKEKIFKKLWDGELMVDKLRSRVDFEVWWKPDQYPCWVPWVAWSECQTQPKNAADPGFRPRMGMGQPPNTFCDSSNNRNLALGYTFQVKVIVTGKCRVMGMKFKAIEDTEPAFAPVQCRQQCVSQL